MSRGKKPDLRNWAPSQSSETFRAAEALTHSISNSGYTKSKLYNRNAKLNVSELRLRETFQSFGLALRFRAVCDGRKCKTVMPRQTIELLTKCGKGTCV